MIGKKVRYTVFKIAYLLNVHPDTIKRWERRGVIPKASRDINNRRYWTEAELQQMKLIVIA